MALVGGTHVKWSPCYHYLEGNWGPRLKDLGLRVRLSLRRCGFYPQGGGEIAAEIEPWTSPAPLDLVERGRLVGVRGLSAAPGLSNSIAQRQAKAVDGRLARKRYKTDIRIVDPPSRNRGTFLVLFAEYERGQACYTELGEIGRKAEKIGDVAARSVAAFDKSDAAVDEYLADQLLLPLSLVPDESRYTTNRITQHLLTNAAIIRLFLDAEIEIQGDEGDQGMVRVKGCRPEDAAS